ncbi:mechanosensitive ion channel-like protein [Rhodovulum imhoffii]|uniref:Mechanosensitive ion channel-like protein n=1 Tax=Rhodovulum imhoffii TaxID=365340 RepID=A0A2T5BRN2_9RHOB|nr:mechanosensitive ion channel domain-containing protein [Rhodovulum imhoffii]PTN01942.1 mechanosensitive ion channel-like protein [Rhodovulum imhoffii]
MENEEQTIVEQEVEQVAEAVTGHLRKLYDWFYSNFLTFESLYQIAAIAATLFLALLLRRRVKRLLERLSNERTLGVTVQRLMRTASAIAMPVAWLILVSIVTNVFAHLGLPIEFLRLANSLLLAFVVIRTVSIFIPSHYWSQVFSWVAWSAAALNSVGLLDVVIGWLRETGFSVGPVQITAWAIVKGLILIAVLIWGASALTAAVERRLQSAQKMSSALRLLITRLLRMLLIVLAVMIALVAIGVDLTVFAVFSGAVGIGVGLGLRRTVENLIASYTLLVEKSVKPGDVIEVETANGPTYGEVKKMTTRYVAVRTRDGTETLIPNEVLISNVVTNWTHSDKTSRRRIPVGVSYDTDIDLARKLCLEAADETPRVLSFPKSACLMRGFGSSSIDLELRFWIDDPENGVANVASEVLLLIWKKFKQHNIEVPYPQQDLRMRTDVSIVSLPTEEDGSEETAEKKF